MKKLLYLLVLLPTIVLAQQGQIIMNKIEIKPNSRLAFKGTLSQGVILQDLSWAWASNNACFVQNRKEKFNGNHVFFEGVIPKNSDMEVTVVPKDPSKDLSIYAFQTSVFKKDMVPNLQRCVRCEADWFREAYYVGKEPQDHTRTVQNLIAISRPNRVVIAVVGAEGLTEGDFQIIVTTKSR